MPAQLLGACIARRARSGDHHALGSDGGPWLRNREALPDANATALLLDAVAGNRIAPWPLRGTGAQIEPGMVPRTTDGAALDDAFRERTPIMRAGRADGADLARAPHQHDRLASRMAEERLAIFQLRGVDSGAEVGTFQLLWRAHATSDPV